MTAQDETVTLGHSTDLTALLDPLLRDHAVPGAAMAVITEDRLSFGVSGVTSVEDPTPVNEDTLFQVGSVTKLFTATVLAMLVEEGRLDLEAPIRTYLPGLRLMDANAERFVTATHLLGHTAGFEGDHFPDFEGPSALERFVETLASLPQHTPLGAQPSYNNAGYSLLGRVIEVLEGAEYATVMQRRVLGPMGMTRSVFRAEVAITHRAAVGHVVHDGAARVVRPWNVVRTAWPAGGLVTSARDLAAFAQFHLGDGTGPDGRRLLRASTLARMRVPIAASSLGVNGLVGTGFAWSVGTPRGRTVVSHGGSTVSFRAQLTLVPDGRAALLVLANADRGMEVVGAIRAAIGPLLGLSSERDDVFMDVDAAPYLGVYEAALHRVVVRASDAGIELEPLRREGGLDAHQEPKPEPLPRIRARFTGVDRAVMIDGPFRGLPIPFFRSASGDVSSLRFVGRTTPRIG